MKETARIQKLFEDLYNGSPWIDVNIMGTLVKITSSQAAKKTAPWNSIWEIANHMISWRNHVLQRLQDNNPQVTKDNYFFPVADISEAAWKETLKRFENSQQEWIDFLKKFIENDLEIVNLRSNLTYYEHIHSIIHQDVYHLGQIVLLSKIVVK